MDTIVSRGSQYEAARNVMQKIFPDEIKSTVLVDDILAATLKSGCTFYVYQDCEVYADNDSTVSFLRSKGVSCYFKNMDKATVQHINATVAAADRQVGGDHYASMKIQPWAVMRSVFTREEYTAYHLGTVMAYLMRHKAKGGEQDIKKAQHHLTELVEYLESENATRLS